jgi:protein-S-isoprenylcysteine O-methyltransferase Ste14
MNNSVLGILGFFIVHLSDYISLKRIPLLKPIVWILGCGVLIYALVKICGMSEKFSFPVWLVGLGWFLLTMSLIALFYSLFINLPFRKTYIRRGFGDKLIKTGFYTIVRHPGVPFFIIFMLTLLIISGSKELLIVAPIYILVDILLVIVQDKIFFPRMFTGYVIYQQETPMLVPNRRSINAFIQSLRQTKTKNGLTGGI